MADDWMLKQVNEFDMGKKGGWFSAVKKALSPDSKDKKDQVINFLRSLALTRVDLSFHRIYKENPAIISCSIFIFFFNL